jgi:hypothetical protein
MKIIPKPEPVEYAPYTIMYIGLLPDDGLILKHLEDNLRATTDFMRALRNSTIATPRVNGRLKKYLLISSMMNGSTPIEPYATLEMIRQNCLVSSRTPTPLNPAQIKGLSTTSSKNLLPCVDPPSRYSTVSKTA